MVAAWLCEHGKSLIPKDQLCPAVLTMNVTLASNPLYGTKGVQNLVDRPYWPTTLLCCQNVSNNLVSGNVAHLGEYHGLPYSSVSITQTKATTDFMIPAR